MLSIQNVLHGALHAFLGVVMLMPISSTAENPPASDVVQLGFVGSADSSASLGVQQGLKEANVQGRFLGREYRLQSLDPKKDDSSLTSLAAVFVASDAETIRHLSERHRNQLIFNLNLDDDSLRSACLANVLHVVPSSQMKRDAVDQWHRKNPQATVVAHAWHSGFEKYSGLQLNSRFQKAYGRPMDDEAWAGWAAVKMLTDSIARLGAYTPQRLQQYLRKDLAFDGQKGIEMNFRPDGQLRQVVLIVDHDKIVAEAPVKGVVDTQDLDSLGAKNRCDRQQRGKQSKPQENGQ